MNKWKYYFDCQNCLNLHSYGSGFMYCMPMKNGEHPIHADDDYRVRCDAYKPAQEVMDLWSPEQN